VEKKELLKAMKEDDEQKRSKGLFDYYFLGIQDEDDDDAVTNVHVWSVNNETHAPLLERCINKDTKNSLVYTIVLNMSKPETVKDNFEKWTKFIQSSQELLCKNLGDKQKQELQNNISRYIQFYTNPEDKSSSVLTDEEKKDIDTDTSQPIKNFGVPIILVLSKLNHFGKKMSEIDRSDHFEIALNYIQKWCVEYGCACFSFLDNQKEQARRLFAYAVHRIQGSAFREGPKVALMFSNIEDDYFFFPSGLKPPNLGSQKGDWSNYFAEKISKKEKSEKKRVTVQSERDDQIFLRTLMGELGSAKVVQSRPTNTGSGRVRNSVRRPPRPNGDIIKKTPNLRGTKDKSKKAQEFQTLIRYIAQRGKDPTSKSSQGSPNQSSKDSKSEALRVLERLDKLRKNTARHP